MDWLWRGLRDGLLRELLRGLLRGVLRMQWLRGKQRGRGVRDGLRERLGRGGLRVGLRCWFGGWFGDWGEGLGEGLGDMGLAGPPEDLVVAQVAVVRDCLHVAFGGLDEFDEVAVVVGEAHVHGVGPPYLRAKGVLRAHKGGCDGVGVVCKWLVGKGKKKLRFSVWAGLGCAGARAQRWMCLFVRARECRRIGYG